jgi:hypothetical protein
MAALPFPVGLDLTKEQCGPMRDRAAARSVGGAPNRVYQRIARVQDAVHLRIGATVIANGCSFS